jgi:hypothetical protein
MNEHDIQRRLRQICQCSACQWTERAYLESQAVAADVAEADAYYAELKARLDERSPA